MFQFAGFPSIGYGFPYGWHGSPVPGFPIQTPADPWVCAPPRGFSQLIASFFGSWCQGIRPAPFLAWPLPSPLLRGWFLLSPLLQGTAFAAPFTGGGLRLPACRKPLPSFPRHSCQPFAYGWALKHSQSRLAPVITSWRPPISCGFFRHYCSSYSGCFRISPPGLFLSMCSFQGT